MESRPRRGGGADGWAFCFSTLYFLRSPLYSPSANRGDWIRTSDLLVPKTSKLTRFDRVKPLENKRILHFPARFAIRFIHLQETAKNKGNLKRLPKTLGSNLSSRGNDSGHPSKRTIHSTSWTSPERCPARLEIATDFSTRLLCCAGGAPRERQVDPPNVRILGMTCETCRMPGTIHSTSWTSPERCPARLEIATDFSTRLLCCAGGAPAPRP